MRTTVNADQSVHPASNDSRLDSACPLCLPRHASEYRIHITSLSSSTLYLFRDQRFRGYCLLIYDVRHATTLDELTEREYTQFMQDLRQAAFAIRSAVQPDHMNYECLGNSCPHLHWHLVPRYRTDPRWRQPIWEGWPRNEFNTHPVLLATAEYTELIDRIRTALMQV